MPYSTLVITAGISALAPRNEIGSRLRESDSPLIFPPGKQNPEARDSGAGPDQLEKSCLEFLALQRSRQPREVDAQTVSAEFSVLDQLRRDGRLAKGALVHLIHTPTIGGRLAVILQKPLLEEQLGVQIQPHELDVPFDPSMAGGLALASGAFIGTVSRLLRDLHPHTAAFAPIGGYKVMVALGHTAASFHGFPSLYLHEDSQVLQEIAPAPIALAPAVRETIAETARRVGNFAEWSDLGEQDRQTVERHPAFFTRVDDLVGLNELGQFLRLEAIPILLSPDAETERTRQRDVLEKQIRQIRDQAAAKPDHPGINHDLRTAPGRHHPWRLARMGDGIRIAWQITPEALLIGKIWRDHDEYDREAAAFIQQALPGNYDHFTRLP